MENDLIKGVVDLPWEINYQGKKMALYVYDYYDEYEDVFCAEYRNSDGHPKLWGYSSVSREDAKNKLALKLQSVGWQYSAYTNTFKQIEPC